MAGRPKGSDSGIGKELDRIPWDYDASKKEPRFFLNPMSSFFGSFPWEEKGNSFPTSPGPLRPVPRRDDES